MTDFEDDMISRPSQRKSHDELVAEIVALRALVSRLKTSLREIVHIAAVSKLDNDGLKYVIH